MAKKKPHVRCCTQCGRDCTADYCGRCIGNNPYSSPVAPSSASQFQDILEDDYGDESDPDSVCDDNHGGRATFELTRKKKR